MRLSVEHERGIDLDQPSGALVGSLRTVVGVVRGVAGRVRARNVHERAAALSYYFLFALFPALLFLAAIVGSLPGVRFSSGVKVRPSAGAAPRTEKKFSDTNSPMIFCDSSEAS